MTFRQLYNHLDSKYSIELRCEWDNDGIMCAHSLDADVKRVLIALDATHEVVDYAIENGFDTVITHHPLVFRSQKSLTPLNYTQSKLIKLISNKVNAMSFHTRLDAADNGVNDVLCSKIGLNGIEKDTFDPIGRIGYFNAEMSLEKFCELVKGSLNAPFVLYNGKNTVKKVYVVGGDGKDLIENALSLGADTILTGRASYNTTIDATDMGINIVEAGHFYTEDPVCAQLSKEIITFDSSIFVEVYNSNQIKVK